MFLLEQSPELGYNLTLKLFKKHKKHSLNSEISYWLETSLNGLSNGPGIS